jgi:arylformamidase
VYQNAKSLGGDPERIYISGHSSGGHWVGVLLTTDWQKDFGLPPNMIKGGVAGSGMFDLKPVRLSARSNYVKFTDLRATPSRSAGSAGCFGVWQRRRPG